MKLLAINERSHLSNFLTQYERNQNKATKQNKKEATKRKSKKSVKESQTC